MGKGGKFKSRAQQRWAFANKVPFARRWAHNSGQGGSKKHPKGSKASSRAFGRLPGKLKRSGGRKRKG